MLTARFHDGDTQSQKFAHEIAEIYGTAMGQFARHMTYTDIVGHKQAWRPEEPGLYQATAYDLIMTSKENFDNHMTAKGVVGSARLER